MVSNIYADRILIIDFGSQYTQLIARRIREIGVYCEIMSCEVETQAIINFSPKGILLSGGPETVTEENTLRAPACVFEIGCPVLGVCYGMQTMAIQLGGEVDSSYQPEFGYAEIQVENANLLLNDLYDRCDDHDAKFLDVWMSHGDHVAKLPPHFDVICSTNRSPIAGMMDINRQFYALQFHPEVTHTRQGKKILENFVIEICGCKHNWTTTHILEENIKKVQEMIGKDHVLVGLSGGVDSAVVAVLLNRAIGNQLTCILVDTGLLRRNEAEDVLQLFSEHLNICVICVDARERFLMALKGISDPEEKRKIIGEQFIRVFEAEAKKLKDIQWLAQGTIYPDVIESAKTETGKGRVIKSHHNVGGLPEKMALKLVEPLRELFKDEVRKMGEALGLPHDLIYRHPFPGPGLAVRIIGEVNEEAIDLIARADAIFIEELRKNHLYDSVSQAFAVFMPVRSVGVKGDARHYGYVIALRAVKTIDFMTADWAELPHDFLSKVSHRIVNEINAVSRVVYDITGKPPATIEWE